MLFRTSTAVLVASLLVGCSSSSGTVVVFGKDAGHPADATKKDVATGSPDTGTTLDAGVDAPSTTDSGHEGDVAVPLSPEAGCPTSVPTTAIDCPLPNIGCLYLSDAGQQTQCACGTDNKLDCAVCPAEDPVVGAACTGGPQLLCPTTTGWCGCSSTGVWACAPSIVGGEVDAGCPLTAPTPGAACAPLEGSGCAFVAETCVCTPGGVWNCNPCEGPLPATGVTQCTGGLPVESCGFTETPVGWFCTCVNGIAACEDGDG